jgi:translation elongation factor EF-1alpha
MRDRLFTAPIPGENLTSNSKNYPWHRPAQYTDFDDAFEYLIDDILSDEQKIASAIVLTSSGMSALSIVQSIMVSKVGSGAISPDMSLLVAGPFYKVFVRLLDAMGIEYLSGYDTPEELVAFAKKMKEGGILSKAKKSAKLTDKQIEEMEKITEEALEELPSGGLMGAPTEEEVE